MVIIKKNGDVEQTPDLELTDIEASSQAEYLTKLKEYEDAKFILFNKDENNHIAIVSGTFGPEIRDTKNGIKGKTSTSASGTLKDILILTDMNLQVSANCQE